MLKTKDILDEKNKILRTVSKEVEFPLTKKDKAPSNNSFLAKKCIGLLTIPTNITGSKNLVWLPASTILPVLGIFSSPLTLG